MVRCRERSVVPIATNIDRPATHSTSRVCGSLKAMFALRSIHLFGCLIALAVAGCANTGDQTPQTSAGGALSRPKTVLIYDFVFSPDVAVVDREFTARLE